MVAGLAMVTQAEDVWEPNTEDHMLFQMKEFNRGELWVLVKLSSET